MKLFLVSNNMSATVKFLRGRIGSMFPVRCQLCGSWGHSEVGRQWICDTCFAKMIEWNRTLSKVKTPQSHPIPQQMELPLKS